MLGINPVMTMGIMAQNTSADRFLIYSVAGSLYANGYLVGNVSGFMPVQVLPNSQSVILVKVSLLPLSVVNDLINSFQTGNFSQDMAFEGYANVDNVQVPFEFTFKLGV